MASFSSEERTSPEETQTLHDKVSKGLEKYLQDTEQCQALEVNYFNDNTTGQNAESSSEDTEQTSTVIIRVTKNPPESLKLDTGSTSRKYLSACTSAEEKPQQSKTSTEDVEQNVEMRYPTEDTSEETTLTQTDYIHYLLLLMKSGCQWRR